MWKLLYPVAFVVAAISPAFGCSLITVPHELDPHEQEIDCTPPERAEASLVRIGRGRGLVRHEDGTVSGTSCDDLGSITLKLNFVPKDDRTSSEKLGYRFVRAGGVLPENFIVSEKATRDIRVSGELFLHWQDGATDEQEPIEFAISIIVVDLGGNESRPSEPIWVRHPGSESQPN